MSAFLKRIGKYCHENNNVITQRKHAAHSNQSQINHPLIAVPFLPHVHNYHLHETLLIAASGGGLPLIWSVYLCRQRRTADGPHSLQMCPRLMDDRRGDCGGSPTESWTADTPAILPGRRNGKKNSTDDRCTVVIAILMECF